MMPVSGHSTRLPKMRLTVVLRLAAPPRESTAEMCVVPCTSRVANSGLYHSTEWVWLSEMRPRSWRAYDFSAISRQRCALSTNAGSPNDVRAAKANLSASTKPAASGESSDATHGAR